MQSPRPEQIFPSSAQEKLPIYMPHSHIVLDLTLSVTGMQERMSIDRPTNLLGAFALGLSDEITAPPDGR